MNQGNPGVAKTFLNGAPIQTSTITDTIAVEQTSPYKIGNANLKASVQNARLYNVAFTDAEVLALYNSVDAESGAVVINVDNVVPFNAGVASITQPTYSVTVSAFEPTWSASGLPAGLSIDASTGAITGTASGTPASTGTDHAVDLMASNGYGKTTKSIIMKAYPMPTSITDGGAIDLGMYGATLTGSFADATGTDCKVHFFVDTADRGDSNVSAWAQHFILENQSPGSFSRVLSGLTFNTTYRYRLAVSNAGGTMNWTTSAGTFATLAGLSAPTLGDVNASDTVSTAISPPASTATLNGTLTATGGENPTVYFLWGDNDAGTDYSNLSSWDNQVAMGVLGSGSFSTNLSGLEKGKVYYFRTAASNGSGSIVSDSLGIFSVSNQGGQTIDVANIYPANMKLWLDANHSSASGATWTDRSSNGNDATKNGSPSVVSNAQNGLPLMRYTGTNGQYHSFNRVNDIRTVFWVVKYNSGAWWLLGDTSTHHFHGNGANNILGPNHYHAGISSSNMFYVNGSATSKTGAWPSAISIMSLVTTADVQANNFSNDRNIGGRYANGDLAELIIYNKAFVLEEVQMVEGYLAHKWGLTGDLPSSHPYKTSITTPVNKSITSASSASGTVGSSFTFTVTTDVTNPAFEAANLPPGLTCALGTGVISGTPLAGGTYVATLVAQSSTSNEYASATLTITIPISAPLLAVEAPGNLVMTSAKLKGSVTSTGGRDATITVYWGDNNASTNAGNWDSNADLGSKGQVALAHDITGLTGGTTYYYAFKGVNASGGTGGTSWSPVQSFTTPTSVSAPILGNLHSVTDITSSAAKLNVNLQSTGGADSNVTLYWGDNDGGTTTSSWDNAITIVNAQPGNLIGEITSGLSSPTIYYFRAKANNWTGTTWATSSSSFTPSSIQTSPTRSANLIGWWKFDTDTNSTVKDSSGNNNHGYLRNSSHALVDTQHKTDTPFGTGKSVDLNGNHYVVVSTSGEDTFDGGNQFTISSWIKELPDGGWEPWVSKRGESGQGWQLRRYAGNKSMILTIRGPGGDDQLPASVNPASWTHVAAVWGGGYRKLFVNGQLLESEVRSGAINVTNSALVFGARDNSGNYNSASPNIGNYASIWLDDVRFYNVFLSDNEVEQIYGGGMGDVGQPWISVTSSASATAATGMVFTYQITATNGPTSYSLSEAPSWMSVNTATGEISGTPTAGGVFTFKVGATNANGTDFKEVAVSVGDNAPFEYSMELTTDFAGMSRSATNAEATVSSTTAAHTSYALSKVFDQDKGTGGDNRWLPFQSALPNVNLTFTFAHPFRVTSYKIKGQNTTYNKRGPKAWLLYGSNDNTNWTIVDDMNASSSDHQTGWTSNQERTFSSVDAEGDYKYYKFQFTQAEAADSYMGFREVDLIGVDYTPVSDFNMLVILDENNATFKNAGFRHSLCQPNGEDLRFQSSAGAELKYEIASWNQSGKSIIWLNIPSLVRNEKITMRWGNSASATPSYVTDGSAWSNYMAVYHLDQAQGQNAPDSGPHNNHATMRDPQNNQPIKSAVSIVGGSYEFPKNQNKDFRNESLSGTMSLDNFALSGWVRATVNDAQDWHDYYGINTTNGGQLRFEANNNNPPRIHVPSSVIVHPNLYSSNNPAGKLNADEWNHLVFSGSGGKLRLYMNGVLNTTADFQESAQVNGFYIANANNNSAGAIHDEVALHKIARHERWANATYKNQNTGSNYVNLGTFAGPPILKTLRRLFTLKRMLRLPTLRQLSLEEELLHIPLPVCLQEFQ